MNNPTSHTVVAVDMGAAGFGSAYAGAQVPAYQGVEDSQWQIPIDPDYMFDNIDAARLMIHAWGREFERADHRHRKGVYLFGPTGSGKTSLIEQFFARLKVPLVKVTWSPKREAEDLLHSKTLVDGTLLTTQQAITVAAMNGFPVLIDEGDLGDPAEKVALNEVIERGIITAPDGTTIRAKRGFSVFLTGNTAGADDDEGIYHGTTVQNASFLRRFFGLRLGYVDEAGELAFLKKQVPNVPEAILESVARSVVKLRSAYEGTLDGQHLSASISRPETVDWVEAMSRFHYLMDRGVNVASYALGFTFTNRLTRSDQRVAEEIVNNCFGKVGSVP